MKHRWLWLILTIVVLVAALPILFPSQAYLEAMRITGGGGW